MKAFKSGSINDPTQLEKGYLGLNLVPAEVQGQKYHVDICLAANQNCMCRAVPLKPCYQASQLHFNQLHELLKLAELTPVPDQTGKGGGEESKAKALPSQELQTGRCKAGR